MEGDSLWERFWDDNHQAFYLFNRSTGESKWEAIETPQDQFEGFDMVATHTDGANQRKKKKGKKKKKRPESVELTSKRDRDGDGDGNADEQSDDENAGIYLITDADRTFAETEGDIVCYTRCMFVTAGLVEGPLVVLEAMLRSVIFLGLGFVYALFYVVRKQERDYWYGQIKKAAREAILCFAAALTFLLPFVGCCVYRAYRSTEEEWDLAPMPTIAGWVDSRRFFVLCMGGGNSTERGRADFVYDDDYESEPPGGVLYERVWDLHMRKSLDSWEGGIPFAPRKVYRSFSNVLRGEESLFDAVDMESQLVHSVSNL